MDFRQRMTQFESSKAGNQRDKGSCTEIVRQKRTFFSKNYTNCGSVKGGLVTSCTICSNSANATAFDLQDSGQNLAKPCPRKGQNHAHLPPEFPEGFAQLGVVEVRVLVGEFASRRLRPHHEGVHRALDVRLPLLRAVRSRRHRHQRPVVPLEQVTDGILDLLGEFFSRL